MDAPVPTAADIEPPRDHKSWASGWLGLVAAALLALASAPAAVATLEFSGAVAGCDVTGLSDSSAAWGEAQWLGDPAAEGATEVEEEDDREGGDSALPTADRPADTAPHQARNSELRRRAHRRELLRADRARAPPASQG